MKKRKLTLGVAIAGALLLPIGFVSPAVAEGLADEPAVTAQTQVPGAEQDPAEDPNVVTDEDVTESPEVGPEADPTEPSGAGEDSTESVEETPTTTAPAVPGASKLVDAKKQDPQIVVTSRTKSTVSVGNKVVFRGTAPQSLVGKRVQLQVASDGAWVKLMSSAVATDKTFRVATIVTKPGAFKYRLYVSATALTNATKSETFAYSVVPLAGEAGVAEIFGTANLAHSSESPVTMTENSIEVRTADCKHVTDWKWAGATKERNRYSIIVPKAGDYRVVIRSANTPYAPWGARTPVCSKAETVTAVEGQRTRHDLSLTAWGGLFVTGKYSNQSHPAIYDRTGTREVAWHYNALPPFSYKVVRETIGNRVFAVFGTKSTNPADGTSVKVLPGKATLVNFSEGTVSYPKIFPVTAKLTVSGNSAPESTTFGETLQASISKLPEGTKVTYQWGIKDETDDEAGPIPGATKSSHTVQASDLGLDGSTPPYCYDQNEISVTVTLSKPGYITRVMSTEGERLYVTASNCIPD